MNLTQLAKKTLEACFKNEKFIPDEKTKEKYKEKKACFVTLTENGELRGCIGCLEARQELWKDVQENAIHAAFHDSRFFSLNKEELDNIKIEISVLSKPKKLEFKNQEELMNNINKDMGIILKKEHHSATFLPQVWKEISEKTIFLEHLSIKAGLNKDAWRESDIEIWHYSVDAKGGV